MRFVPLPSSAPYISPSWKECRKKSEGHSGRRVSISPKDIRGAYVRSREPEGGKALDIALDASMRAAVSKGRARLGADPVISLSFEDIRVKKRRCKTGASIVFLLDSSGSMGVKRRMAITKGALFALLDDSYRRRDRVALVACRGNEANVELPFTSSVQRAEKLLAELPTGGRTPLASGLVACSRLFESELKTHPYAKLLLVIVSDGKANVPLGEGNDTLNELRELCEAFKPEKARRMIVDAESGLARFGQSRRIAEWLKAELLPLDSFNAETLAGAISQALA